MTLGHVLPCDVVYGPTQRYIADPVFQRHSGDARAPVIPRSRLLDDLLGKSRVWMQGSVQKSVVRFMAKGAKRPVVLRVAGLGVVGPRPLIALAWSACATLLAVIRSTACALYPVVVSAVSGLVALPGVMLSALDSSAAASAARAARAVSLAADADEGALTASLASDPFHRAVIRCRTTNRGAG
jgi:hypothetical protein